VENVMALTHNMW